MDVAVIDGPKDASNEPLEIKIISAASDGFVRITPEKCERIRELIRPYVEEIVAIQKAVLAEREACLQLVDACTLGFPTAMSETLKAAIRARGGVEP
jgi:hypothetical protein